MALGVCSGCRRFARGDVCPFCGAGVAAPLARVKGRRMRGLVGPIVAIAVTAGAGCGVTEKPSDGGKGDSAVDSGDDGAPATLYGGVPFDAGSG